MKFATNNQCILTLIMFLLWSIIMLHCWFDFHTLIHFVKWSTFFICNVNNKQWMSSLIIMCTNVIFRVQRYCGYLYTILLILIPDVRTSQRYLQLLRCVFSIAICTWLCACMLNIMHCTTSEIFVINNYCNTIIHCLVCIYRVPLM